MMRVIKPGALTTLQDLGRYGSQRFGVPVNGVMDEWAHRAANLLVGNEGDAVSLEITLTGPTLRFERDTLIALTGAELGASVDGVPVQRNRAVLIRAGVDLVFSERKRGARAYLAVRGGFRGDAVMGSASTFLRGGFGGHAGRALMRGDRVAIEPAAVRPTALIRLLVQSGAARIYGPVIAPEAFLNDDGSDGRQESEDEAPDDSTWTLRCIPGPQWDRFDEESRARFVGARFRIDGRSDRMGYRLSGVAIHLSAPLEMISEATSFGTVQVPPDGNPIVLMADRQSAGGYPKIAYVATVDLPLLAQSMPGQSIGFELITLDQAQALYLEREAALQALQAEVRAAAPQVDA